MATTPITVGSICTGYGGFELALAATGITHELSWLSENNHAASTLLTERFTSVPNLGDINNAQPKNVDLITAGFPCQDISTAGTREGIYGSRSGLWWRIVDVISQLRPEFVLLENVAAILTTGGTSVIGALTQNGYDTRWITLRASTIGAPHRRDRWFCFAWNTQNRRRHNKPTPQPASDRQPSGTARRPNRPTTDPDRAERIREHLQQPRRPTPTRRSETPTDTNGFRRQRRNAPRRTPKQSTTKRQPINHPNTRNPHTRFGPYQHAITRWEQTIGRPAPTPAIDNRLNPIFVEWMMGLPAGWVTNLDISRTAKLQILGNGIVPQQATHAIHTLTNFTKALHS